MSLLSLWKTTLVIFSKIDPRTVEASELLREAESGSGALVAKSRSDHLKDATADKDWDGYDFFGTDHDEAEYQEMPAALFGVTMDGKLVSWFGSGTTNTDIREKVLEDKGVAPEKDMVRYDIFFQNAAGIWRNSCTGMSIRNRIEVVPETPS